MRLEPLCEFDLASTTEFVLVQPFGSEEGAGTARATAASAVVSPAACAGSTIRSGEGRVDMERMRALIRVYECVHELR